MRTLSDKGVEDVHSLMRRVSSQYSMKRITLEMQREFHERLEQLAKDFVAAELEGGELNVTPIKTGHYAR